MAGIYIHIPFCKQACHYCNFHFSTTLNQKGDLVKAILKEIELQKDYLSGESIKTIYFGGGTPSILTVSEIDSILNLLAKHHNIEAKVELTLEANPDDLNREKLSGLKSAGINRLSIGIQSFHEEDLEWMNRSHNVKEAIDCIGYARTTGFDDLSIDLIFGSNTTTTERWAENLAIAADHDIPHLSCYGLTVESGTALNHFIKSGKQKAPSENLSATQFELTMNILADKGYEQYEISNYAKDKRYSIHNTNYWKQVSYLGLGPAAHSYNGTSRQWNVANNPKYISSLSENVVPAETEILSSQDKINEYLLTGLRTIWGCEKKHLATLAPDWRRTISEDLQQLISEKQIIETQDTFHLSAKGKFLADSIISQLFLTHD